MKRDAALYLVLAVAGGIIWVAVSSNLLPLGVIVFGILSIPAIVTANVGAKLGAKRSE